MSGWVLGALGGTGMLFMEYSVNWDGYWEALGGTGGHWGGILVLEGVFEWVLGILGCSRGSMGCTGMGNGGILGGTGGVWVLEGIF